MAVIRIENLETWWLSSHCSLSLGKTYRNPLAVPFHPQRLIATNERGRIMALHLDACGGMTTSTMDVDPRESAISGHV